MFTLIKNANLYSPEHLGMNDVLLADDKIALIDRKIELTGIPVSYTHLTLPTIRLV